MLTYSQPLPDESAATAGATLQQHQILLIATATVVGIIRYVGWLECSSSNSTMLQIWELSRFLTMHACMHQARMQTLAAKLQPVVSVDPCAGAADLRFNCTPQTHLDSASFIFR